MSLDINTLTKEQKEMLANGYRFSINENNKMETQEPIVPNEFSNKINREKAYKSFHAALLPINSHYSDSEVKTFFKKEKEAREVIQGGDSKFINDLLANGETAIELANKIMINAQNFETIYAVAEKQLRTKLKKLENNI